MIATDRHRTHTVTTVRVVNLVVHHVLAEPVQFGRPGPVNHTVLGGRQPSLVDRTELPPLHGVGVQLFGR